MFKKWKLDKSGSKGKENALPALASRAPSQSRPTTSLNPTSNGSIHPTNGSVALDPSIPDSYKSDTVHVESAAVCDEEPYDPELEWKVLDLENANYMPYGDGSDKVFGMENFGYTCYIASILQALYYTSGFRHEVLSFPKRDSDHPRKRKVQVPGRKAHAFTQGVPSNATNLQSPSGQNGQTGSNSANGTSNGSSGAANSKMRSLFSKHSSENASSAVTEPSVSAGTPSSGSEDQLSNSPVHNAELQGLLLTKYPAYENLRINYTLNQQKNITVVGVTDDPSANSEQRKRQALLRGPIVNLDHSYNNQYGMEQNLFSSLKDLFESMAESLTNVGIVSAQMLVEVVKRENEMFRSSMHQDAHEFLNFLINNVTESIDSYCRKTGESTRIHDLFEGLLVSETMCLSCENVSTRDEMFLDLSIDLQPNTSISNCLRMFSQIEMLNESNKFFCENCHSLQEAAKTIKLKKLPKILALHLKRFKYAEELGRNVKLFYRVEYSKYLRIFNTTDDTQQPDKLYELYSVVVHIGGGPYHGHYVSLVKTDKFGWLLFDDETVECVDENYVYRFFGDGPGLSTAYLLFYREVEDEASFTEKTLYNGLDSTWNQEEDIHTTALDGMDAAVLQEQREASKSAGSSVSRQQSIVKQVKQGPVEVVSDEVKRKEGKRNRMSFSFKKSK